MDAYWLARNRAKWQHRGQQRPGFAIPPSPGQESVWDYPRPPALEENYRLVTVFRGDARVAHSPAGFRVLETAGAPTYYLPPDDVAGDFLKPATGHSFCEWKGRASYWALRDDPRANPVAWSYPRPFDAFLPLADYLAFYPSRLACFLGGEAVHPQPGGFYGGWVTQDIVGPFKGEPGTEDW